MKNINRSGLIIFLVIVFLFTTCLISADIYARVWIKQEVNLGEPGGDPNLIIDNNINPNPETVVRSSATQDNKAEVESVSALVLYSKIIFNQFLGFLF
ncbi:MAG TPA: hypothetical protein VKO43_03100 [Candidatus Krumholzibacteriaceae bacterium]|nr:hypothetical protein [Candidatus Krumholzibacteriaceae bacterium]